MAGIDEAKAGVSQATEKVLASIQALNQAAVLLDEARTQLAAASAGTSRPEAPQALGMIAQTLDGITTCHGSAQASITAMESWNAQI